MASPLESVPDEAREPAPGAGPDSGAARGRIAGILALLVGVIALASSLARYQFYVEVRQQGALPLLVALGATGAGLALAFLRRGSLPAPLVGVSLAGCAIAVSGLPELPLWPSVDAFGFSPQYLWVVAAVLLLGIPLAAGPASRAEGDAALALFVAFSAFSGPLFIRDPDEYFPLLVLMGGATALAARSERRSPRHVPFALLFAAIAIWTFLPVFGAEDRHRHLAGWSRLLLAGVPMLLLGFGPIESRRARVASMAFCAMAGIGGLCAVITILEAGHAFSLAHALKTRLRLFGQDPNIIAPYFAVAPPVVLALLMTARRMTTRVALGATLALVLGSVVLTKSKTSIAATAFGLLLFGAFAALVSLWRRRPQLRKAILVTVCVVVATGLTGTVMIKDRVLGHRSIEYRVYLWETAVRAIEDRPILGYGLQTREPLMVYAKPSHLDGRPKDTHPHQIFLNMAMGAGIPAAVLLFVLMIWFTIRMALAATRLEDRGDRLLASSLVGSGAALLTANMLDQGLALNTPIPLHFGLLLGVGSLLVLRGRGASRAAAKPSRFRLPVVATTAVFAFVALAFNTLVIAGERLRDWTDEALQKGDGETADRLSALNARLNPWSLDWGLRRVDVLVRLGRLDDAIDHCWELARLHPLSWQPVDRISTIEFNRGALLAAKERAEEALKLDPTGPRVPSWLLRCALVQLHSGRYDEAVDTMATAFRYDFNAPKQLIWSSQGEFPNLHWQYDGGGKTRPVFLRSILERNRRLIPEMCKTDWVRARRIATTIAKIGEQYMQFEVAKKAIEDFKKHSPHPWMALDIIKEQMEEAERRMQEKTTGQAESERRRTFRETEFEGEEGEAAIYLARGDNFYDNGEPERALVAYKLGLDALYDMYAEKHYAKDLVLGAFRSALRAQKFDEAYGLLKATLYFHRLASDRIKHLTELAWYEREAGRYKRALEALEMAADYVCSLPVLSAVEVLQPLAGELSPFLAADKESGLRPRAMAILNSVEHCDQGKALKAFVVRTQGNHEEFKRLFQELEEKNPAWKPPKGADDQ